MTESETLDVLKELAQLFPRAELTESELSLFRRQLPRFNRYDAIAAIRSHRLVNDTQRPKIGAIVQELCGKVGVERAKAINSRAGIRTIDALKRSHSACHRRDYSAMSDIEFTLRYGRALFRLHAVPFIEKLEGREDIDNRRNIEALIDRRKFDISTECAKLLTEEAGMSIDQAGQAVPICWQRDDATFGGDVKRLVESSRSGASVEQHEAAEIW